MHRPRFHSSPKYGEDYDRLNGITVLEDRGVDDTLSVTDLEGDTITKQRRELKLLIGELKDRDKELNEMVAAHQRQLTAWERDRQRLLNLEQKNEKLEDEVRKRNEQLRLLIQRLKHSECRQKNKDNFIEATQTKLINAEKVIEETSVVQQDLQTQNDVLNTSLNEMTTQIGRLEIKEQDFVTKLQLKDGELVEAESEISELRTKLRCLENDLKEAKEDGVSVRLDLEQQRVKFRQCRAELDKTSAEMATKTGEVIALRQELTKIRDEIQRVKRELYCAEEQIKRKEEIIEMQKSKQDRADAELSQLRQLYDRQQEELSLLQLNLETSREMLAKQEQRMNHINMSCLDLNEWECSSQTTNDLIEEARRSTEDDTIFMSSPKACRRTRSRSPQPLNLSSSSTSKLHRLLSESRQMVHNMEQSTLVPTALYKQY